MPITRDDMMADNMDWRTNQRLRMYELYVQMKMRELQESGETQNDEMTQ
jgi:hypothetical protein